MIHITENKNGSSWKISAKDQKNDSYSQVQEEAIANSSKKEGTVAGAVALIIGTSIGSGILALPKTTSPAGVIPSSISMIICWAFLLIEALVLVEINVGMLRRKKKKEKDELEIISIRTMAEETLGEWGGGFASATYVFLGYTSMIAYISKSGEILSHLINIPEPVSGTLFTILFTILIAASGTQAIAQLNQWLTASMLGLLLAIEVLAIYFGGWTGLGGDGDWQKVPATLPVIIFSLVYHDLAPVLCAYLGGDLERLRTSVVVGSSVPLLALLLWDSIILGLPSVQTDEVIDPFELFMRVRWSGVPFMVEAFALLAVGTSLIGTLLSLSGFFKEKIYNFLLQLPKEDNVVEVESGGGKWCIRRRVGLSSIAMVVAPALFISTTIPHAFSTATDIAGGYCMTMLYGVLPPAMAWAVCNKEEENHDKIIMISTTRPLLIGLALFACGIVVEQILQDLSNFNS